MNEKPAQSAADRFLDDLSPRQRQIVFARAHGVSWTRIGKTIGISAHTVKAIYEDTMDAAAENQSVLDDAASSKGLRICQGCGNMVPIEKTERMTEFDDNNMAIGYKWLCRECVPG